MNLSDGLNMRIKMLVLRLVLQLRLTACSSDTRETQNTRDTQGKWYQQLENRQRCFHGGTTTSWSIIAGCVPWNNP